MQNRKLTVKQARELAKQARIKAEERHRSAANAEARFWDELDIKSGWGYVGVDISEEYVELSNERLKYWDQI